MSSPQQEPLRARKFKTSRSVTALVLREMATTYGRSPGGYIWAVLEPVAAISVLSIAFSLALRSPSLGTNFIIFYASGYLPFSLYMDLSAKIAASLNFSRALLQYPAVSYIDSIIARFILNGLTQVMVFYVLVFSIRLFFDTGTVLDFKPIVLSMVMASALGLGVGCLNCFLMSAYPVWRSIWTVVTRPLFLISAVLFILEDAPPTFQKVLWFNPLTHITGVMRTGFYPTYEATYVSVSYVFGVSLILLVAGLLLLNRYHADILEK
jgi:capsular polysaccharide transport system permease protein